MPGTFAFVSQTSIFSNDIGEGRNIDIDLTGPELSRLVELGGEIFGRVMEVVPGSQVRPIPSLDLGAPELRVEPKREQASALGLSASDVMTIVSSRLGTM